MYSHNLVPEVFCILGIYPMMENSVQSFKVMYIQVCLTYLSCGRGTYSTVSSLVMVT